MCSPFVYSVNVDLVVYLVSGKIEDLAEGRGVVPFSTHHILVFQGGYNELCQCSLR